MTSRSRMSGLVAGALALLLGAPAVASSSVPAPEVGPNAGAATSPRRTLDGELPTDGRPIVATVVEVNEATGTVMLSTPHGPVALSVTQELAERLSVGDVVVVQFIDEEVDETPSASPRIEERERI